MGEIKPDWQNCGRIYGFHLNNLHTTSFALNQTFTVYPRSGPWEPGKEPRNGSSLMFVLFDSKMWLTNWSQVKWVYCSLCSFNSLNHWKVTSYSVIQLTQSLKSHFSALLSVRFIRGVWRWAPKLLRPRKTLKSRYCPGSQPYKETAARENQRSARDWVSYSEEELRRRNFLFYTTKS